MSDSQHQYVRIYGRVPSDAECTVSAWEVKISNRLQFCMISAGHTVRSINSVEPRVVASQRIVAELRVVYVVRLEQGDALRIDQGVRKLQVERALPSSLGNGHWSDTAVNGIECRVRTWRFDNQRTSSRRTSDITTGLRSRSSFSSFGLPSDHR